MGIQNPRTPYTNLATRLCSTCTWAMWAIFLQYTFLTAPSPHHDHRKDAPYAICTIMIAQQVKVFYFSTEF